jgi:hypothetical protein
MNPGASIREPWRTGCEGCSTQPVVLENAAYSGSSITNPAKAIILKCDLKKPDTHPKNPLPKGFLRSFVRWLVISVGLLWSLAALIFLAARWIDPPTTAVHMQHRLQAWLHQTRYRERYKFVPLSQVSPDLQHAVIAAEDARFYQHHGFDWHQIQIAAEDDLEGDRIRGGTAWFACQPTRGKIACKLLTPLPDKFRVPVGNADRH